MICDSSKYYPDNKFDNKAKMTYRCDLNDPNATNNTNDPYDPNDPN